MKKLVVTWAQKKEGAIIATFPFDTQKIIVDYIDQYLVLVALYIPSSVSYLLTYVCIGEKNYSNHNRNKYC